MRNTGSALWMSQNDPLGREGRALLGRYSRAKKRKTTNESVWPCLVTWSVTDRFARIMNRRPSSPGAYFQPTRCHACFQKRGKERREGRCSVIAFDLVEMQSPTPCCLARSRPPPSPLWSSEKNPRERLLLFGRGVGGRKTAHYDYLMMLIKRFIDGSVVVHKMSLDVAAFAPLRSAKDPIKSSISLARLSNPFMNEKFAKSGLLCLLN